MSKPRPPEDHRTKLLVDFPEAAFRLSISLSRLQQLVKDGEVPVTLILPEIRRISVVHLEAYRDSLPVEGKVPGDLQSRTEGAADRRLSAAQRQKLSLSRRDANRANRRGQS